MRKNYKVESFRLIKDNSQFKSNVDDLSNCVKTLRMILSTHSTKKCVGDMTKIVSLSKAKTIDEFRNEYLNSEYGDKFIKSREKYVDFIKSRHMDRRYYTDDFVREYFERKVINESFVGIKNQNIICEYLANKFNTTWKMATSKEDSNGIDAYIGDKPIQVKPISYAAGKSSKYVYYDKENDKILYDESYFMS